ncbi:hypothetical protein [Bosea sp. TAF32]|uniref:hypothetical protein n=1 Tax=Bosea sp. TAF32 TaxID=3237482 RepID=UPI003F92A3BE
MRFPSNRWAIENTEFGGSAFLADHEQIDATMMVDQPCADLPFRTLRVTDPLCLKSKRMALAQSYRFLF